LNIQAIKERLPVLSSEERDASALHEVGFSRMEFFYATFTFKGWVAYRN